MSGCKYGYYEQGACLLNVWNNVINMKYQASLAMQ